MKTKSEFLNLPPNLKGFQVKTMQKWCFLDPLQMEFGPVPKGGLYMSAGQKKN